MKKTILITGATDGIGKQTALELAQLGHHIIIHGRSDIKCRNITEWIKQATGNKEINYVFGDFSSLKDVRILAENIKDQFQKIDILINNAGVYMNEFVLTPDGFETTFAVNHLAPFLLTNLLFDLIKNGESPRIINLSSIAHTRARLEWDNLNCENSFDSYYAYSLSKLANILFSNELARKLEGTGITVNSLHPGVISTKLLFTGFNIEGSSLTEGAKTSVYLATSQIVEGVTGKYFVRCEESPASAICSDKAVCEKMWQVSADMVGI